MGQSTDAKVWFGFCWTTEDQEYYDNGLPSVVVEFMKRSDQSVEDEEDAVRAVEAILNVYGCRLIRHCCGDYTMHGLAVSDSALCASRGYPINLTDTGLITTGTVNPEWLTNLQQAAKAIGWPEKPPAWWLASYWD